MARKGDDRAVLEATRAAVTRYARQAGWKVGHDALDAAGWEGVYTGDGDPGTRFVARRSAGASHTSFASPIELSGAEALRLDEVRELCAASDLGVTERRVKGGVVLEAATRIWDGGLNRETFEGVTGALLELADAVRDRLEKPSG